MYEYYFTFLSVTMAQRGLEALLNHGIYAELVRTPRRVTSSGCGYSLKVQSRDGYGAAAVLKNMAQPAKIIRIYFDGKSEVVTL